MRWDATSREASWGSAPIESVTAGKGSATDSSKVSTPFASHPSSATHRPSSQRWRAPQLSLTTHFAPGWCSTARPPQAPRSRAAAEAAAALDASGELERVNDYIPRVVV